MMERSTQRQRGVILIFALIALISMTLAAVALIRSTSTGLILAGSFSARQGTVTASDVGINSAMYLFSKYGAFATDTTTGPNQATFNNQANYAYLASYNPANSTSTGIPNLLTNAQLANFDAQYGNATGGPQFASGSGSGETWRYLIERMCDPSSVGAAASQGKCILSGQLPGWTQTKNGDGNNTPQNYIGPVYRVTVRVDTESAANGVAFSPYNATSFAQTMIELQ